MGSTVGLFYLSLLTFQRFMGLVLHAGHPLPLVATAGFGAVFMSNGISQSLGPGLASALLDVKSRHLEKDELMRKTLLGTLSFAGLERNLFKTALPSSIITKGVYARPGGSVRATGDAATQAQRKWIQRMGKLHGCHHCGFRPVLDLAGRHKFIADHMPPTHRVNMVSKSYWRKVLKLPRLKQMLYPQCAKCCGTQASAARLNMHKPIFHSAVRSWHLAPALAILVADQEVIRNFIEPVVDMVNTALDPAVDGVVRFVNDHCR